MIKTDSYTPKSGMNRQTHPSELKQNEYSFALNANIQDEHSAGDLIIQNEISNVKCSGFKDGFVVLKHKYDRVNERTYFFLLNPDTGCSEIGWISSINNYEDNSAVEKVCKCEIKVVLEDGLENIIQESMCEYNTLISDYCDLTEECTGCLNFKINYPIRDVEIRYAVTGTELYFTDGYNPQRFVKIDEIEGYFQDVDTCEGTITPTCLQCDKLRMFPLFDAPCLNPDGIQLGGTLKAGVYEALIAYSDSVGNTLSEYYSLITPISIFDPNNNILDQTSLDYQTNFAFSLSVSGLDPDYEFYKIVVIYTDSLNSPQYYEYGVFSSDEDTVVISSLVNKSVVLNPQILLEKRTTYLTAKGMAGVGGTLIQHGLTAQRTINLQPVVNLMGGFVKWGTIEAQEDLYEDGINTSKYKGYMRDEIVPFSIQFRMTGGYTLPLFPFIPRPPKNFELDILGTDEFPEDSNTDSILSNIPDCAEIGRNKRWQFENTATVEGNCYVEGGEGTEVIVEQTYTCLTETNIKIGSGKLVIETSDGIAQYIEDNKDIIISNPDPQWDDIKDALLDLESYGDCDPEIGSNCSDKLELVSENVVVISVEGEKNGDESIPYEEYERVLTPTGCENFVTPLVEDTDVESAMRVGDVVYKKTPISNTTCTTSSSIEDFYPSVQGISYHLVDGYSIGSNSPLLTSINVSTLSPVFNNKLHSNVAWFSTLFLGEDSIAVEISNIICSTMDDNTNNSVRISVFEGCPILTEKPSYGRIVSDLTTLSDSNRFLVLNTLDFPSGVVYIAIDSPMSSETEFDLTVSGTSGSGTLSIEGDNYPIAFNTDVNTTASNFVSANSSAWLSNYNLEVISVIGGIIKLRGYQTTFSSVSYVNSTGDLNVVKTTVQNYYTLQPPCSCFGIYRRRVTTESVILFDSITFGKYQTYKTECRYTQPNVTDCDPAPHKYGNFSYWESQMKYPCNPELWDSSELTVELTDIPDSIKTEFEDFYTLGSLGTTYLLDPSETNFMDKKIRHYKFPDSNVIPFMSTSVQVQPNSKSIIYPIGVTISNEVINAFLDIAVNNELLSLEDRLKITSYEIYRGDRVTERSIVAKGLLFDMYKYNDESQEVFYPNFPLNSLRSDNMNGNVPHPYLAQGNNQFTFHSPETHFYKPTLPNEMNVEGYQFGKSLVQYDEVRDHSGYTLLGRKSRTLATVLGSTESAFELLMNINQWTSTGAAGGISAPAAIVLVAALAVASTVASVFRAGKYRYQWLQTFEGFGQYRNLAYYGVAEGFYNQFVFNTQKDSRYRGLDVRTYLKEGRVEIRDENTSATINVNNLQREDSVFIKTDLVNYPSIYSNYDNGSMSSRDYLNTNETGRSSKKTKNTASPYVSIKQYLPNQYNNINSISWLNTGYCGNLEEDNTCQIIFGGDIFITRFSLKRKFPFFTQTAHNLAPNVPFKYSNYFNIKNSDTDNRTFLDFKTAETTFFSMFLFPEITSDYRLHNGTSIQSPDLNDFYVKENNKFYVYFYGIPYFLVESEVNNSYRYGKREAKENFYPNVGDVVDWTQESNVPIQEPNLFFYNPVYSKRQHKTSYETLPVTYARGLYDKLGDLTDQVIFSQRDNSDSSLLRSPWNNYLSLNYHRFNRSFGGLIDVSEIESEQVWFRFRDGLSILGAIDTLKDRLNQNNYRLGVGLFDERALSFNNTELGHGGTQHKAKISCEFGHYWVDSKRGKVFELKPNAKGLSEISISIDKWFKDQLPFSILKSIPNVDIDNSYNGVGITMGWDDRFKRLFITKRDYEVLQPVSYDPEVGFYSSVSCPVGYNLEDGMCVSSLDGSEIKPTYEIIELTDETYFKPKHWTIGYSPLTKMWLSYYSFIPNYYIGYNDYFQTGVNNLGKPEHGLWSHLPFLSSYQVFYGKLYPFIVEHSTGTNAIPSLINSVEYWLDVRKYYDKYDFTDIFGRGFNKAFVYNNYQNSGELKLNFQEYNDRSQILDFPKYSTNSIDILQSEMNGKWSFNYLYNIIRNERAGLPIWKNDNTQILKTIDERLVDYGGGRKDRLRGDYFLVRLIQDEDSRFKMLFRISQTTRNYYQE